MQSVFLPYNILQNLTSCLSMAPENTSKTRDFQIFLEGTEGSLQSCIFIPNTDKHGIEIICIWTFYAVLKIMLNLLQSVTAMRI